MRHILAFYISLVIAWFLRMHIVRWDDGRAGGWAVWHSKYYIFIYNRWVATAAPALAPHYSMMAAARRRIHWIKYKHVVVFNLLNSCVCVYITLLRVVYETKHMQLQRQQRARRRAGIIIISSRAGRRTCTYTYWCTYICNVSYR